MNIAIIFAGGVGSRMGALSANGPKQYFDVGGKPILAYTLERFERHSEVDRVYLVVNAERVEWCVDEIVQRYGFSKVVKVVAGGDSALASIANGLEAVHDDQAVSSDDVVLIHDGVRPVVDQQTISRCIASALEYGSGVASVIASETVAHSSDGGKTIDVIQKRSNQFVLRAPQAYRFGEIYELNQKAKADGLIGQPDITDQATLRRHYGLPLNLVPTIRSNVKITTPDDYYSFRSWVSSGEYERMVDDEKGWAR
jgi:2-C-methyl-D-erythritol 4-phosphate cytidylyltransferase